MDIIIRNKWVSIGGSSEVKDINGVDLYKVKGKVFTFTRKKFITALDNDNTIYEIRNKFWSFFVKKAYVLNASGEVCAFIKRKYFSVHDRYFIDSQYGKLEITGNILGFDYHIKLNDQEIGHVSRKISVRDSFILSIDDTSDIPFYIALVIAIDNITDTRRSENVSFNSDN